jgi:hypothetical protein
MIQDQGLLLNQSYSPEYRHQCAVRQLCIWRSGWGLEKFRKYIQMHHLPERLLSDFVDQYSKGNRGEPNSWK